MQDINIFDLQFYEYSQIADDPKKLEQLQNHYYDPEFEEWLEEFDQEQSEKTTKSNMDENLSSNRYSDNLPTEEYEIPESINSSEEWEEVD